MEKPFLRTERLILKKMSFEDFDTIAKMLKNPEVMYAWGYDFSDDEVNSWIQKNINLYKEHNLGYFLAVEKQSGLVVGQIALMPIKIKEKNYLEVGYILNKEFWGKGYAQEGARALLKYAFEKLGANEVIATIRPKNKNSIKVAKALKMKHVDEVVKVVKNKKMLHLIFSYSQTRE